MNGMSTDLNSHASPHGESASGQLMLLQSFEWLSGSILTDAV